MKKYSKIRWGIIGCGDVTEVKSGPGFQKAEGSELIAVMRRSVDLAKDYALRHSVPKWYDNATTLINDPEVDAVYIATPPSSHKEYTFAAALAGKPVYVEKPMAMNYTECMEMVKFCKDAGAPLFVAYYRRALPRFLKIKSLIEDGAIGEVRLVNMQFRQPASVNDKKGIHGWRLDPSIAGCGYFCDLGSHMLDLIQYFLGKIISAQGEVSNLGNYYKTEDTVSALFKFESGAHGIANWCFDAAEEFDKTEIIGSKGKIIYSNFADASVKLIKESNEEEFYVKHPEHIAQPLIQTVVNELIGKEKCPSTGETGAYTSFIMDKILGRV